MLDHPDSALMLLESQPAPSSSRKKDYATYSLLLTQARDKNYITPTSDSLINIAVEYFLHQDDIEKKISALYYAGRVNKELNRSETAVEYYLKALEIAKTTENYNLISLIYSNLGMTFLLEDLPQKALPELYNALHFTSLINDSTEIIYALRDVGRVYNMIGKIDSAEYYYNKGIAISRDTNNDSALFDLLNEVYSLYKKEGKLDLALKSLIEAKDKCSENKDSENSHLYKNLGEIYFSMNQLDSAKFYLTRGLVSDNIYTQVITAKFLYQLYKKERKYEKAIQYADLYNLYNDSIILNNRSKVIAEIQAKYNQEKLLNTANQLKIEKDQLKIVLLIAGIITIFVIALIVLFYQKKLIRKERNLQKIKEQIRQDTIIVKQNEATIRKNEDTIKTITKQLQESNDLKEQLEEQLIEIENINKENEKLINQNLNLKKDIEVSSSSLETSNSDIETYEKVIEKNSFLQERVNFLSDLLIENIDILSNIRNNSQSRSVRLDNILWEKIILYLNLIYENYSERLHAQYPILTTEDMQFCCLIKLRLSTSDISKLCFIAPPSVTKRKQRIKEKIRLDRSISLDTYLWDF